MCCCPHLAQCRDSTRCENRRPAGRRPTRDSAHRPRSETAHTGQRTSPRTPRVRKIVAMCTSLDEKSSRARAKSALLATDGQIRWFDRALPGWRSLTPCSSAGSISSRYESHALALGARSGRGAAASSVLSARRASSVSACRRNELDGGVPGRHRLLDRSRDRPARLCAHPVGSATAAIVNEFPGFDGVHLRVAQTDRDGVLVDADDPACSESHGSWLPLATAGL